MIEVELKIAISNVNEIRRRASLLGKYKGKQRKVDDYYTLESLDRYPKKSLRVRKLNRAHQINFKHEWKYEKGVHAKKEVEFNVSDINGFLALIKDFGYKKWARKEKITELYEIAKILHIEINNVHGLGWFVEVEYLAKPNEIEVARKRVLLAIKSLGLAKKKPVKEGYTKMLWNKGLVK